MAETQVKDSTYMEVIDNLALLLLLTSAITGSCTLLFGSRVGTVMSISFSLFDSLVLTAFVRRIVSSFSSLLVVSIRMFGVDAFVKVFVFIIVFKVVPIKVLNGDEDCTFFVILPAKVVRGDSMIPVMTTGVFTLSAVIAFGFGSVEDILISVTTPVATIILESVLATLSVITGFAVECVSSPITTIGSEVEDDPGFSVVLTSGFVVEDSNGFSCVLG